jgi:hypothetical protein
MIEKISQYCRNVGNFVYEQSLSIYELLLLVLAKSDELVDSVNNLEDTKEDSSNITNQRHLDENGNFTGTLAGMPITQTEVGISSIVAGLLDREAVVSDDIDALQATDLTHTNSIGLLVAKDIVHEGAISDLVAKDLELELAGASYAGGISALVAKDLVHDGEISTIEEDILDHIADNDQFLHGTNSLPTPMTYNSSPTSGDHISVFDGDMTSPKLTGNIPSVSIQRVDESPGLDTSKDHLTALLVTHRRKAGSRGYAFASYNYLEDESNEPLPAQSVACAGSAHSRGLAQVWGLYGEGWQHDILGTGTGCELDSFNYSGVDNEYVDTNPFLAPHSKGLLIGANGLHKALMALGITSAGTGKQHRVGIYMSQLASDLYGIDMHTQARTLIRFKNGAKTDGVAVGIGLDTGENASYGVGHNQGAIHLWDNTLCFGQNALCSYFMRVDTAGEKLLFGRTDSSGVSVVKGYIDLSVAGVSHAL